MHICQLGFDKLVSFWEMQSVKLICFLFLLLYLKKYWLVVRSIKFEEDGDISNLEFEADIYFAK